jgi:WD40 repeat protein
MFQKISAFIILIALPALIYASGRPELRIQTGHSATVGKIVSDRDGRVLVSCSQDKSIIIWDIASGKELLSLHGHRQPVQSIAISRHGNRLASGGNRLERNIILWDIATGSKMSEIEGLRGEVVSISINAMADKAAAIESTGTFESAAAIWDFMAKTKIAELPLPKNFIARSISFNPAGHEVAVSGEYTGRQRADNILIYDSRTGRRLHLLKSSGNLVSHIEFSTDGSHLLSAGTSLQAWSSRTWQPVKTVARSGTAASYGQSGRYAALAQAGRILILDMLYEKPAKEINAGASPVTSVWLSPDERYVMASLRNGHISMWEIASGLQLPHFSSAAADVPAGIHVHGTVAYIGSAGGVHAWDLSSGRLSMLEKQGGAIGSASLYFAGAAGSGLAVSANSKERGVSVWELATGKRRALLEHTAYCRSASLSPDAMQAAAGTMDNLVLVWDINKPAAQKRLRGHTGSVNSVAWRNGSAMIASAGQDKTIRLWDAATGAQLFMLEMQQSASSVSFSPDGENLLVATSNLHDFQAEQTPVLQVYKLDALLAAPARRAPEPVLRLAGHSKGIAQAAYSATGRYIYSASHDNTAAIYDAATGKQLARLEHAAGVRAAAFTPDEKYFLAASADGQIKIWNMNGYAPIISAVSFGEGRDFIAFTPDNYYTSSPGGVKSVHFVNSGKIFLFDQFDLRLNRPDIIVSRLPYPNRNLGGAYKRAYIKRLEKSGFTEAMLGGSFSAPETSILNSAEIDYYTANSKLTLKIAASDAAEELDRLIIWINDVPIYGSRGIDLRSNMAKQVRRDIEVLLMRGRNKIQVSVLNKKGAESMRASKLVYLDAPERKPDLYIVAIGVSRFRDSQYDLDYAAKDAHDIAKLFQSDAPGYGKVHMRLIADREATAATVKQAKKLFDGARPDDHAVLFIASHGLIADDMAYYLAMHDTDFSNPKRNGLSYDELENIIDGIGARNKLLLIDACHSGEIDDEEYDPRGLPPQPYLAIADAGVKSRGFKRVAGPGLGMASSFELMKELFADLRRGSGAAVIASAAGKEYALESNLWNNGVFTFSFLEGIKNRTADLNGDGNITVSELRDYVSSEVSRLTAGKQNPTARQENLENDFKVW